MKRVFDIFLGCLAALILLVPVLLVAMAVRLTSKGPALYWSDRVGRNNVIFKMPKFRSMRVGTPAVATHLLADAQAHLTTIGSFSRKSSLDKLPIPEKVKLDVAYLQRQSLWFDIWILWLTFVKVLRRDGVLH